MALEVVDRPKCLMTPPYSTERLEHVCVLSSRVYAECDVVHPTGSRSAARTRRNQRKPEGPIGTPGMHPSLSKAHGARNMPIGKDAITAFAATELSVTVTGLY